MPKTHLWPQKPKNRHFNHLPEEKMFLWRVPFQNSFLQKKNFFHAPLSKKFYARAKITNFLTQISAFLHKKWDFVVQKHGLLTYFDNRAIWIGLMESRANCRTKKCYMKHYLRHKIQNYVQICEFDTKSAQIYPKKLFIFARA